MTRRLVATYLTITAFVLAMVVVPFGLVFAGREKNALLFDIERDAQVIAQQAEDSLERGVAPGAPVPGALARLLGSYRDKGGRAVVVDSEGISVADSGSSRPEDFSTRPEIIAALGGRRTDGVRHSKTLGGNLMYVAVPVASGGVVHGAVRITYPTSALDSRVRSMWLRLGLLSLVVLVVVTTVGVLLARGVSRPARRLRAAAGRMARGDLSVRVDTTEGAPELRDLAVAFNTMVGQLCELIEAQRRFVADASHQLRTPLAALRLRLETLGHDLDAADRPKLDAALAETARLSRLVQSLLVLARIDSAPGAPAATDVAAVVRERTEVWSPVAADQRVTLRGDAPASLYAQAIPGAVDQILDNLISNALEVAPAGSAVTVSASAQTAGVELRVEDEGPGMDAEQRRHAFERFWRPPGAAQTGFGLGLAIVAQLAEASGGRARLEPRSAGGLAAIVELPAARSPEGTRRPAPEVAATSNRTLT